MAMLDCFLGYHQIWLHKEDEEKTSFIIPFGTYCYMRMPEGVAQHRPHVLQNEKGGIEGPSRQECTVLSQQHHSWKKKKELYISDLLETFANMREANLKLNLEKYIFGVTRGKVLGCLVSNKGIEASPDKIRVIIQMHPP
jgi:hypothetical protein